MQEDRVRSLVGERATAESSHAPNKDSMCCKLRPGAVRQKERKKKESEGERQEENHRHLHLTPAPHNPFIKALTPSVRALGGGALRAD